MEMELAIIPFASTVTDEALVTFAFRPLQRSDR